MTDIKVFDYIPQLDAFLCTPEIKYISNHLLLTEWTPVVWMGRLFSLDQDFGEHWFDNWDEREDLEKLEYSFPEGECFDTLMVVVPERFSQRNRTCFRCDEKEKDGYKYLPCPKCGQNIFVGSDGPCYSDVVRKAFWTDVCKSLKISLETLFTLARENFEEIKNDPYPEEEGVDIEARIEEIRAEFETGEKK